MINSTQEIIDSLKKGKMVIIMDDENRENEGDLVIASEFVKPKDINFMASKGRGLICMTLTQQKCKKLGLPLMKNSGESSKETNFTVSIDAASGISTGISASDRAETIKIAVDKKCKPSDLIQPGHVFPLMAKDGGVLVRAGHTEAGCDLAKLAGLEPSSVIVEILNEDGSMARKKDLLAFSKKHKLKIGTIEDLIKYKTVNERTIKKIEEKTIKTEYGIFNSIYYKDIITNQIHFVLIKNKIDRNKPTVVRVHVQSLLVDTIKMKPYASWSLDSALKKISKSEQGALVFISHSLDEIQLDIINSRNNTSLIKHSSYDYRTVGIGAQILNDIGVKDMILLSRPIKYRGINAFGLNVVEYMSK
tara:strand:- start:1012 stop:2097 length:1086 start_codon:yes stop_codon:yes gene_type:complete